MSKNLIAIDCGGTNLRVALMDEALNILAVRRVPSIKNDPDALCRRMMELIAEVESEAGRTKDAIGMSICGVVSHNKVGRCCNLGIDFGFDFYDRFKEAYPDVPVRIANDGNCSAYVESRFGVNQGYLDSGFITISSGIGIGIIHNGEMIDLPLEAGRQVIEYRDKLYEAEYLCSGNGIVRLCAHEGMKIENARAFFELVKENDTEARRIYNIWLRLLGTWLGNLQLLFDCQSYAISGGTWQASSVYKDDLAKVANATIASWHINPIVLRSAKYNQDVGLAGAASLALHELEK